MKFESTTDLIKDDALKTKLLNLIRGRGAFRRFKNLVTDKGIDGDWYQYRSSALKQIAREFLEKEKHSIY